MADPKRLLDETNDPDQIALLRAARGDAMAAGSRARILAELGVSGGVIAGVAASAAALASKKTLAWGGSVALLKWLAIGALGVAVPLASIYTVRHVVVHAPQQSQASVPERITVSRAAAAVPTVVVEEPSEVATPVPEDSARALAARSAPAPSASASLGDEVAVLKTARRALAAHDAPAALRALDRYAERFPKGRIMTEATVVRIEALVMQGDRAAASKLADGLLSQTANSPYEERVRALLSGKATPERAK